MFVLSPDVHLLDVSGPAQVFGTVGEVSAETWQLNYVADTPEVRSAQGLTLRPDTTWPALETKDIVVVPGWQVGTGSTDSRLTASTLTRIADHHARGGTVLSICSGAFALADAAILDGRRATTHHQLQDTLAAHFPGIRVVHDVLYVSDGTVHSSAGIASGIDLALHIISQRIGAREASAVARAMVVYARRNGHEDQSSALLRHRDHVDDLVHHIQDIIDDRYTEPLPLAELAQAAQVSERTLTRSFTRSLGITPLQYQQVLRQERAEHLIGAGSSVESAAREVGFRDARMLRTLRHRA
ncbi:MAG: GlxA family transcriptional regulator [Mycobacteriaceae bacterium]|uniref:GlxA family transcriptional regulator n=1 Tax=Corynebacterium sp. TaxID=1720 RepID=UPI003F9DA17B